MRRGAWALAGLAALAGLTASCQPRGQNLAGDTVGAPKTYLASQSSDAQRAIDSMPAPTGGDSKER